MIAARERMAGVCLAILLAAGFPAGARAVPDRPSPSTETRPPAPETATRHPAPALVTREPAPELVTRFANLSTASLPRDFVDPEGRTRWDFRGAPPRDRFTRRVSDDLASLRLVDDEPTGARAWRYVDPEGGAGALRFLRPDRLGRELLPGTRAQFRVDRIAEDPARHGPGERTRFLVTSTIAGIGWAHLPSGPREVVLERLFVLRASGAGFVPDRLVHRFVDPRAGVVAEISGPATPDGRARASVTEARVAEAILAGAADLRLYVRDLWSAPLSDVVYSRDRGAGTPVSALTPAPGVTTIGQLIALDTWDFSGNTTGLEVGATTAPMNAQETCNIAQCGYSVPGAVLDRTDRSFDVPANLDRINTALELEVRPADTAIWMRAGAQHEGKAGALGTGESRFCYTTFDGVPRTPAPLWLLPHEDAPGTERYMLPGDTWSSAPFNCEQNLYNQVCGASQLFDRLWTKACDPSGPDPLHNGTQSGGALKNGVITLPSGHTFNTMLARNVADFCVWAGAGCLTGLHLQAVRTVNYLWQVPVVGTVVRLQSALNAVDLTSWPTVQEGIVAYGHFPPRTIQVTATGDSTVSLSWDPGLDTHRITGYKVYWDTDSGGATPYAFDSASFPGQAAIAGTTAVISGLTPGTPYYFTVTALTSFTSPSSGLTTHYESMRYPTQVSGDPAFVYPVEATATTTGGTCLPASQVANVQVSHATGSGITICWDPLDDPCLTGYRILGAATPVSAASWTTVADTDLGTCWTGNPSGPFFLVVARGTGGTGPWGHYGQ